MNNFQKLQEQQEEKYYSSKEGEDLKKDLMGTLSTFRFIGSVIDVYLPRVVDMFIAIAGGGDEDKINAKNSSSKEDPASGSFDRQRGKGPGGPGDIPIIR
ncbi:MAG: hypothetical protein KDC85_13270 [Saprospiraceae bacterium]|nr:hypothetical protein [Saprospiraceae bacterium]MCB9325273.1 hypothetical protein [Lewinellaceae bacterium]